MENENFDQAKIDEAMSKLEKTVDEVGVGSLRFADGELVMFSVEALQNMIKSAEEKQLKRVFFFINLDQEDSDTQKETE